MAVKLCGGGFKLSRSCGIQIGKDFVAPWFFLEKYSVPTMDENFITRKKGLSTPARKLNYSRSEAKAQSGKHKRVSK